MPPDLDPVTPAPLPVGRIAFGPVYDPAVDAVRRGLLDASVLSGPQMALLEASCVADPAGRPHPALPALVIDLADPDPAPAGDPVPGHLLEPCFWPSPVGPVLRADRRAHRPAAAAAARARATPEPEPGGWSLSLGFALVAILSGLALLLAAWFAHRFPLPPAI